MLIRKFSHHFEVSEVNDPSDKIVCGKFGLRFAEYGMSADNPSGITRMYATSNAQRSEFRFHINSFDDFIQLYRMYDTALVRLKIVDVPMYKPAKVEYNFKEGAALLDTQVPFVDFIMQPGRTKLVGLQTGGGKTFLTLWAIKELGVRAVIVLKGGYIERWLPDLIGPKSLMGLKEDEVRVIRGLASMMELCQDAVNGNITESIIIFSTDTLRMYQDHYFAMNGDMQIYSHIPPYALFEALGAGVKVVDEVHQLFHANFRTDLYTHIPLTISLSATMVAGSDNFKQFLYDTMFPKSTRADPGKYNKYIEMYALMYNLDYKSSIVLRWNRKGTKDYSQNEFEKSILKNAKVRDLYLAMITNKLNEYYVTKRTANEKCLVFAGTVDMCSVMVTCMKKLWPKLKINKYTSEDDYSVIAEADIIVSTVGSLGTAHDIPDLWQVHKTVGLGKEDTNLQVAGRLRVMKNFPGRTPLMYYWTCEDIDKHMRYHRVKQELFRERVLKLGVIYTGFTI